MSAVSRSWNSWFPFRCGALAFCSCSKTLKGYKARNGAKDKYHKNFLAVVERLAALHLGDVLGGVEVVAFDEREAEDRGQLPADRGLAAAAGACYYYAKRL
mgnify:CR=1 FL=1